MADVEDNGFNLQLAASSDEEDARPRIDNFMVGEESKRNNNHRYSAGLGSMASAFKSQDTVKN